MQLRTTTKQLFIFYEFHQKCYHKVSIKLLLGGVGRLQRGVRRRNKEEESHVPGAHERRHRQAGQHANVSLNGGNSRS